MRDELEKVALYTLGGIVAFIFATIIVNLNLFIHEENHVAIIFFLATIIGIFISATIIQNKKNRLLKQNNKIRDEAITLITHEMRTGLTSTGWTIQSILDNYKDVLTAEDKNMLRDALNSIHIKVLHTVNLLDISLLDVNKLLISLEWTTLEKVEEMIRETASRYKLGALKTSINITTDIKLNPTLEVEVDMMRLRIILENLLENTLQYTLNHIKNVKVTATNNTKELSLSVSDAGIGIPFKERDKIFSQFYRASNARNKLSTGSGIGLYMCRQYVKAHRGSINFMSKENEGTTFYITIPLKTSENVKDFLEKI